MKRLKAIKGVVASLFGLTLGWVLFLGASPASADLRWAVVRYDGSVAAGKNVDFVQRNGPGSYQVEFKKKDLSDCAFLATLGGSAPFDFGAPGQISVSLHPSHKGVWVLTRTSDGQFLSDRGFHLKVFC